MKRVVLITGASGFVGRQVLKGLAGQPVHFRLVARDGGRAFNDMRLPMESLVHSADLFSENASWWESVCQGVDTVIHLAWYAEPGKYLQSSLNMDCLSGTLELAKGCVAAGVRRFIGTGTCFEYDLSSGYMSVDTPLKPTTPYAAAKASVFFTLSHYFAMQEIEFAWCRLFYLYGEGEDERRLVPYLRSRLSRGETAELTSGVQIRDFIDVGLAGRMIAQIALGSDTGAINICSGRGITVRALAEEIADEYGRRDLLCFGARPDNLVDPPCVVGVGPWRSI